MSGKDQERFEDYLELERYIEKLQAGDIAHLPKVVTLEQARIYLMVMLFRSASPENAERRTEFTTGLQARLEQELQQIQKTQSFPLPHKKLKTWAAHSPRL